ncbi:hypothetical protein ACLB2K_040255 [Fragaria x ananassa]
MTRHHFSDSPQAQKSQKNSCVRRSCQLSHAASHLEFDMCLLFFFHICVLLLPSSSMPPSTTKTMQTKKAKTLSYFTYGDPPRRSPKLRVVVRSMLTAVPEKPQRLYDPLPEKPQGPSAV